MYRNILEKAISYNGEKFIYINFRLLKKENIKIPYHRRSKSYGKNIFSNI